MKKQWLELFVGLVAVASGCTHSSQSPDMDMTGELDDAALLDLTISQGTLSPVFAPLQTSYSATERFFVETVTLTPTAKSAKSPIAVNGVPVLSGTASQPITLSVGPNPITVEVIATSGQMRRYELIVTRTSASIEYLKASNTDVDDGFGRSISLDGDTLAVGAFNESSSGTGVYGNQGQGENAGGNGAVYIFTRSDGVWTQQAYIKASNTRGARGETVDPNTAGDLFGSSVSLSGDILAVGAPEEDSDATGVGGDQWNDNAKNSGAVYVFTRSGTTWTQEAYIKASNTGGENIDLYGDYFGNSVSLSGNTLAVGARWEDSKATGVDGDQKNDDAPLSGAVYIFTRSDEGAWTQQAYLKASNTGAHDSFGCAVSLFDDTLAVGAFLEDSGATGVDGNQSSNKAENSGAVYVFNRSEGTWSQQAYLKASNTQKNDWFGWSVAVSGDTLAVGAIHESANAIGVSGDPSSDNDLDGSSGAVYVFNRSEGTWSQQAYLKSINPNSADLFGWSVAVSGDALAVGATGESSSFAGADGQPGLTTGGSGAVYVFTRHGDTWTPPAFLKASNPGMQDVFGSAVSLSGDSLAIGANGESSSATGVNGDQKDDHAIGSGATYVYQSP